jgi:hypothetical protein
LILSNVLFQVVIISTVKNLIGFLNEGGVLVELDVCDSAIVEELWKATIGL